jgi:cytochrome b6-f complex iron-sulfur subunit
MTTAENAEQKLDVNRQEFLNLAWLASMGFFFVSIGGVTYFFSMPRFKEGEFGGVITVGNTSELPEAESQPVGYPKVKFWLSNTDEGVKALYTVCTHLGCLYKWSDQEDKFICPCHGSQFELDGTYIQGPAPRSLDTFAVQLVDPQTQEIIAETSENGDPPEVPGDRDVIIQVDTGRKITGQTHG